MMRKEYVVGQAGFARRLPWEAQRRECGLKDSALTIQSGSANAIAL
jgi:hypothetical protein